VKNGENGQRTHSALLAASAISDTDSNISGLDKKTIVKRPAKLRQLYSTKLVYRNMFNEVVETFTAPIFQLLFPNMSLKSDSGSSSSSSAAAKKNFTSELENYFKTEILQETVSSSASKNQPRKFDSGVDHIIAVACFATLRELVVLTSSDS
jgi:hypothetical protein